ncbi:hypothetical protein AZE42_07006 [Rhizopogon vesiculosus]|uniref:GID complex catalytic subunit 2 n=1 Tax=Rhizopogon vesiculosus TaxID=180088 RepID=A0A1J8QQK0_9AGAM|nr:hypothetical protein AZE42_07006 [Rhizopogon vesiculosus]
MDAPLKELLKLEKLTEKAQGKTPSIDNSLDSLLQSLREAKDRINAGSITEETYVLLAQTVEAKKKEIDEKQKEIYNGIARFGKALDKRFTQPLPTHDPLFTSERAQAALERTIALHFLRTGQFSTAETFIQECGIHIEAELQTQFQDLHRVVLALKRQDIGPALEWSLKNREFLRKRSSPLEFYLHRSQFIRLLLSGPLHAAPAISYANATLRSFYPEHATEFQRLLTSVLYLPKERLQRSPYADLASDSVHTDLEPLFAKEYCANLGMSRQVPLRVIGDIGGGGALARIEKARTVMKERKSEWSQTDELPIEIPLAPENRYHSIFACPVSKEQSTDKNPPMMMTCGHVISKDSLQKLCKSNGRVKCPYCPAESAQASAMQVHF